MTALGFALAGLAFAFLIFCVFAVRIGDAWDRRHRGPVWLSNRQPEWTRYREEQQ